MKSPEKFLSGWIRMEYVLDGEARPRIETRQGYFDRDGNFYFSAFGRGAQEKPFSRLDLVTELVQTSNGRSDFENEETRTIELGPGVIYQYNEATFVNVDGDIHLTMMGFNDQLCTEIVPQGLPFGGAMPTTIFVASEQPGIAIHQ